LANSGTTAYPASLDAFVGLGTARKEDEAGYTHVSMHNQDQAAVLALQTTLGTTGGTSVLKTFVAGDFAARVANETLTAATLGTPAITGGTITTGNIHNPTIGTAGITFGTATNLINVPTIGTATDAGTVTFDLALKQIYTVVLGGNRVLAVSNAAVGKPFIIRLKQDGTGSRTVTWWSTINWVNDTTPTLGTAVSSVDVYGFLCTSTDNYDGYVVGEGLLE